MIIGNAKVVCNGTYGTYYIVQECLRGSQALFMPLLGLLIIAIRTVTMVAGVVNTGR